MALFLPQRWKQQPLGPVQLNRGNPITNGIVFAYCGSHDQDVVQGTVVTRTAVISKIATMSGISYDMSGAGEHLSFAYKEAYKTLGDVSGFWFGVFDDLSSERHAFGITGSNGASVTPFLMQVQSGDKFVRIYRANTTYVAHIGNTALTAGADVKIGFSAVTEISTAMAIRVNKAVQTVSLGGSGTGAATLSSSVPIRIGSRESGSSHLDGKCYTASLWARQMSESEYRALEENPWQIFQPISARIYSFPSGAAATTPKPPSGLMLLAVGS